MGTQLQNAPDRAANNTAARIVVALLLLLSAVPVFYLGILGFYALFWLDHSNGPGIVQSIFSPLLLFNFSPLLVVFSAFGTLLSFRCALMTAGALAVFYLGWAFTLYPFTGLLPNSFIYVAWVTMFAILCLNLTWIVWSLRGRLALRG